jgi:hypothetical protein
MAEKGIAIYQALAAEIDAEISMNSCPMKIKQASNRRTLSSL